MAEPVSVAIDIRDVPAELVRAVDADAKKRDMSISDRIAEILCARYGLEHVPNGYPYTAGGVSNHWNVRVPERAREALRAHAKAIGGTTTGCVLLAVSDAYGLPPVSPRKRVEPVLTVEQVREAREAHAGGRGESLRSLSKRYKVTRKALTRAIRG